MKNKTRRLALITVLVLFLWACAIGYGEDSPQWRILIQIPSCTMTVYQDEAEWKKYPVAVGKPSTPTPEGVFEIISKVKNPTWCPPKRHPVPPGPRNPLGRFWMGLSRNGYGIHGNNSPKSIGHHVTNGCIRLRNEDAAELFQTVPYGTPVVISYDLFEIVRGEEERPILIAYPDVYRRNNDEEKSLKQSLDWNIPGFPAHIGGLRWILGIRRPAETEIPKIVLVVVDEAEYASDGFVLGDKAYLSADILRYWGEDIRSGFVGVDSLVKDYGVQIVVQGEERVELRTVRVFYQGTEGRIRGRCNGEPKVDLAEFMAVRKMKGDYNKAENTLTCGGKLIGDVSNFNGRPWIGLAGLKQIAGLSVRWDSNQRRLDID